MRSPCAITVAACLLWSAETQAQYYRQDGPTLLPVPQSSVPTDAHGNPGGDYRVIPNQPAVNMPGYTQGFPSPTPAYPVAPQRPLTPSYATSGSNIWNDAPAETIPTPPPAGPWDALSPTPAGPAGVAIGSGGGTSAHDPTNPYQDALCSGGDEVVVLPWGGVVRPNLWFGSLAGIAMTRDGSNKLWTSFNVLNAADQVLNTQQASANWQGGGQVMIGRWFGCCNPCCGAFAPRCGIQAIWWGLAPMTGFASIKDPNNNLNTPINLGYITIGPNDATQYFDNAAEHTISRRDTFQNAEVNFLQRLSFFDGAPRMMFTNLAGVRYFRFSDNVTFGSVAGGHHFGDDGGADEAYLSNRVVNNLIGLQIGTRVDYFATPRFRLFAAPTFAVMGNHMTASSQLFSGDGLQGFNNFTGTPVPYNSTSSKNTCSLLGQIDVGLGWQITPRFCAFASYRVVAVSRVGQADNQFTPFLADAAGIKDIQTNGDLILHGAVIGGQWNY
jgi:hypothetical protein